MCTWKLLHRKIFFWNHYSCVGKIFHRKVSFGKIFLNTFPTKYFADKNYFGQLYFMKCMVPIPSFPTIPFPRHNLLPNKYIVQGKYSFGRMPSRQDEFLNYSDHKNTFPTKLCSVRTRFHQNTLV